MQTVKDVNEERNRLAAENKELRDLLGRACDMLYSCGLRDEIHKKLYEENQDA